MARGLVDVDDAEQFDELAADGVTVFDFYGDWCGPCVVMDTFLAEFVEEEAPDARFARVDVEAHEDIAADHDVRSVPTLVFYRDGVVVGRHQGLPERHELRSIVRRHVRPSADDGTGGPRP